MKFIVTWSTCIDGVGGNAALSLLFLSALVEVIISHFEEVLIDAVQTVLYITGRIAHKAKNKLAPHHP